MNRIFRGLRWLLLIGVIAVLVLPLFSEEGTQFGLQPGLLLLGIIFLFYALLGRFGILFQPSSNGHRLQFIDLLLIGAFPLYLLYFGNERFISSLDTLATRQLPVSVLTRGTLDLSQHPAMGGNRPVYSVISVDGEMLSAFPIGTGLLAIPHVAIAMSASGKAPAGFLALMWEKHFAALLSALTVLIFFYAIRSRFEERIAFKSSVVFALATSMFSCVSQAMWSFTGEMFFLSLSLFFLLRSSSFVLAGLSIGAAFLCRPTAVIFLVIAAPLMYGNDRRGALLFLASAVASILVAMLSLWSLYGHPLGGYGLINQTAEAWKADFISAVTGNLFSPSRGFFVFFPFVAITLWVIAREKMWNRWLFGCLASITLVLILTSLYGKWWGGHSLGPRLLTETSLFIALLTIPVWIKWSELGWVKILFVLLLSFSIATQFLLAYNASAAEWSNLVQVDQHPEILWSWGESQLASAWGW